MPNLKYLPEWSSRRCVGCAQSYAGEDEHITSSMMTVYTHCPDGKTRAVFYGSKRHLC
jgi:hypothetical protein